MGIRSQMKKYWSRVQEFNGKSVHNTRCSEDQPSMETAETKLQGVSNVSQTFPRKENRKDSVVI